jgi:NACHT C-terminal Alpha/Beta 2
VRDDFSATTIRILAGRVGHRCSNPDCRRSTIGPALEDDRTVNIGVAAHITAASEGGPRYDKTLTPEARSAAENGVWLCQTCAKLIDSDAARFTSDLLRKWKRQAVANAFKEIATSGPEIKPSSPVTVQLDDADRKFLQALALPQADTIESVTTRLLQAAATDIATFLNSHEWPAHAIALSLSLRIADTQKLAVTLDGVAKAIGVGDGVSLVSSPGTGKSTTLVQLSERILAAGQFVPLLVPLGEWSDRNEIFFDFVNRRNAFGAFRRQHFMQLAYHGRLVLLLDGWNELDPDSRTRAIRDLRALRRDYPLLGLVIGTRRHAMPIEGALIEIEPLSYEQQMEIARAQRGNEGEALVDEAWRTAGIRELISIPLYLNALLAMPAGLPFPQTKEEVLRMFVLQHERKLENAEILRRELYGFHTDMLVGLAIHANQAANTSIQDTSARQVINAVETRLSADGQLTIEPAPTHVLDVLVGSHVLVRPTGAGAVMFQHQQFQEWYASYEVERLMQDAAGGDAQALNKLRQEILDWPAWEESVLFACERLSRDGAASASAVALAIGETLGIDPMLAAEMIFRSASDVWPHVADKAIGLVERWHQPGKVDRAVRFMITSGRPEFAERIWPLISDDVNQVHLRALRAAEQFRPPVLGDNASARLAALPEATRNDVISEIARNSGYDGMKLAADLAKKDPSPAVVVDVVQALQFRHGDRHVTDILKAAPDAVWREIAREGYPDELSDVGLQARLSEMRRAEASRATDPRLALDRWITENTPEAGKRAAEFIRSRDFPIKDSDAEHALQRAFEAYPKQVAEALASRITASLDIPYDADRYLDSLPAVDEGPIVPVALSDTAPDRARTAALKMVGPKVVGQLMDELFVLHDEYAGKDWRIDEAERKKYNRLKDAILASRQASFLDALFARASTDQPKRIRSMADLITCHGKGVGQEKVALTEKTRDRLTAVFLGWINILLTSKEASRHYMSDVAWASQRFAPPELVPKLKQMLDRDLADRAKAIEEFSRTRTQPVSPDVTHSYTNIYQGAFAAIGGAEVVTLMKDYLPSLQFGVEAAQVLATLWHRAHPSDKEKPFFSWHDFSGVKERQSQRRNGQNSPATCDYGEAVFTTVKGIMAGASNDAERRHAIALAQIGLGLPQGDKRPEIDHLLKLPLPYAVKRPLLTAAAIAGEVLPAKELLAGVRELLEAAKKETWRLESSRGELVGWIELFAFCDRPTAVLEALDELPTRHREPWELERLLTALSSSPHPDALGVIETLAKRDPRMLDQHEWLNAKFGTEASALALLDHVCNGILAGRRGGIDTWHMAQHIAGLARKFPKVREELIRRYRGMPASPVRNLLEGALAEIPDSEIIMLMVAGHAGGLPFSGHLRSAIRNLAVGQRPVSNWPGAFQEFSVSLKALRKNLFGLISSDNSQAGVAEACLNYIDKLRDEHGRINDEPRHPDIQSGRPWPRQSGT